jgi:hypothetical protein
MTRRLGESAMWRRSELLSRAKRALEYGGLTPLFVARDREDALASARNACATRNL